MNSTIPISYLVRKQGHVITIATAIAFLGMLLSFLESRSILPKGTSTIAFYVILLFVWPCLSAVAGAMIPIPQKFGRRTASLLLQFLTALILGVMGIVAALGVLVQIPLQYSIADLPFPISALDNIKDINYFFSTAGWFPLDIAWSPQFIGYRYQFSPKLLLVLAASLVCFSCALLFSSLLSRAKPAAISGLVGGLSISGILFHCWIRLSLPAEGLTGSRLSVELGWILSVFMLAAFLIFVFVLLFRWSFQWSSGKAISFGSVICAVLASAAFFAFAYPHSIRISPKSSFALPYPLFSVDGKAVIVDATKRGIMAPHIWSISTEGKGAKRLAGRLAFAPFLSPDGNLVAYFSQRNWLGLARDSVDLRAVWVDGTHDRLLVSQLVKNRDYHREGPCDAFAFSPDSSRIAVACEDMLTVVELSSSRVVKMALPSRYSWCLAWNSSQSEVLLKDNGLGPPLAYDPTTRQTRTIRGEEGNSGPITFLSTAKGTRFVMVGNSLLDLLTNKVQRITDSECYMAGISSDEKFLVYANAKKSAPPNSETEFHWRELDSGKDELAATLPGRRFYDRLLISPRGDKVVIDSKLVIEKSGAMRNFPDGWAAFGWSGNGQVGLIAFKEPFLLALCNPETMQMRIIYP